MITKRENPHVGVSVFSHEQEPPVVGDGIAAKRDAVEGVFHNRSGRATRKGDRTDTRDVASHTGGKEKVARWIEADGKERKFFMGDTPCFADFILGAGLEAMKRVLGEDGEEWRRVTQWHGGRWGRLVAALEEFAE